LDKIRGLLLWMTTPILALYIQSRCKKDTMNDSWVTLMWPYRISMLINWSSVSITDWSNAKERKNVWLIALHFRSCKIFCVRRNSHLPKRWCKNYLLIAFFCKLVFFLCVCLYICDVQDKCFFWASGRLNIECWGQTIYNPRSCLSVSNKFAYNM